MKQNRHTLLAKTIMVLLSLLILVFVFSYAWYLPPDTPADATGLSVSTSTTADFQIALGFNNVETSGYIVSDFMDTGDIDFGRIPVTTSGVTEYYDLLKFFTPVDLTSDGVTFIRPEMLSKNTDINLSKNTYEYAAPNEQYISFDLYIRSETAGARALLGPESCVFGVAEGTSPDSTKLIGTNSFTPANLSDYGNFSEDSVVGAVRLSFVNYTDDMDTYEELMSNNNTLMTEPAVLWIPRSDIFLKDNGSSPWTLYDSDDAVWTTGTATAPDGTTTDTYENLAATHYYYGIFESTATGGGVQNYKVADYAITDLGDTTNNTRIVSAGIANTADDDDHYLYGKCQVNIWVDGCDAEARRAIDGGQFKLSLELTSG